MTNFQTYKLKLYRNGRLEKKRMNEKRPTNLMHQTNTNLDGEEREREVTQTDTLILGFVNAQTIHTYASVVMNT